MRKIAILAFDDWKFVSNILFLMQKESKKITLIVPQNFDISPIILKNYRIFKFRNYNPGKFSSFLCFIDILRIFMKEKFDLIHIPSHRPFLTFLILFYIKFIFRNKLAITKHEPFRREGDPVPLYAIPEYFLENLLADYLILGGAKMYEKFIAKKRSPAKIFICGLGVFTYLKLIYEFQGPRKAKQILITGRMQKYKGLGVLIESLKYVNQSYELIIAGSGRIEKNQSLIELVRQNKVKIFNRYISDNQLYELISSSGVVVTPYLTGTQSGIISNSFAFNTPVITTNVGSVHENVLDGVNGFIIEPNNPQQLAEKLNLILNNEELQAEIGKNISYENQKINNKIIKVLSRMYFSTK